MDDAFNNPSALARVADLLRSDRTEREIAAELSWPIGATRQVIGRLIESPGGGSAWAGSGVGPSSATTDDGSRQPDPTTT